MNGATRTREAFRVAPMMSPRPARRPAGMPRRRAMTEVRTIRRPAARKPGPNPPRNIRPTETLAMDAYTTMMMLGGMIGPRTDAAPTSAAA